MSHELKMLLLMLKVKRVIFNLYLMLDLIFNDVALLICTSVIIASLTDFSVQTYIDQLMSSQLAMDLFLYSFS